MSEFKLFSDIIESRFSAMACEDSLFRTQVTKDELWDTYLNSFPEGTNPMYRERTEHDCQCCKRFIRAIGNVVSIKDGKLSSIWDIQIDSFYQSVADAMNALITSRSIENVFLHYEGQAGQEITYENTDDGVRGWNHFYAAIPKKFTAPKEDIGTLLSVAKGTRDVYARALKEIPLSAIDTVLELIQEKAIYKSEEFFHPVNIFRLTKIDYLSMDKSPLHVWNTFKQVSSAVTNIRNSAIGTLLVDISNGVELDEAVRMYESKVAPQNYKRSSAVITPTMIKRAQSTMEGLGLIPTLDRRFAVIEDVAINDVLFADRSVKPLMQDPFDMLAAETKEAKGKVNVSEDISIESFMETVLPRINSLELLLENRHESKLVSIIAPKHRDAANSKLLKWENGFSWAYKGDVTDSIRQRVKAAGGKVDGDLRCSLSWFNYDDLDIHLTLPNTRTISFRDKYNSQTQGSLDVDMNAGGSVSREAVENITFPNKKRMLEGTYRLQVHNFSQREGKDVGFVAEIEFGGTIWNFVYDKLVRDDQRILVAEFEYFHKSGITLLRGLSPATRSKKVWGLDTEQFHKVDVAMLSPNYWGEQKIGNKHYFFILRDCLNPEPARGFFNEFLHDDLRLHRKVFEVLGSKMKAPSTDQQLSGLGFSSTIGSNIIARVKGDITRTFKIIF